jgi:phage tail-like protein
MWVNGSANCQTIRPSLHQREPAMPRHDPFRGFRFRVEIDAIASASFSEVVIGITTTDVVDYRDGDEPAHVRKLSGLTRFGNVILRRGMTTSLDLVQWHQQIVNGGLSAARKEIAVAIEDETGADVARFTVTDAWPVKFGPIVLNATSNEVLIETLELANEGIERTK